MPPTPIRPMPMKLAIIATRAGRMPFSAASSGLSAEARIALPIRVKASAANTSSMIASATPMVSVCCGFTRNAPKCTSRAIGRSKPRMSLPKPRRTTFSSTSPEAIDAMAAGRAPCLTSGRCATLSRNSPTAPATTKATHSEPTIWKPAP